MRFILLGASHIFAFAPQCTSNSMKFLQFDAARDKTVPKTTDRIHTIEETTKTKQKNINFH